MRKNWRFFEEIIKAKDALGTHNDSGLQKKMTMGRSCFIAIWDFIRHMNRVHIHIWCDLPSPKSDQSNNKNNNVAPPSLPPSPEQLGMEFFNWCHRSECNQNHPKPILARLIKLEISPSRVKTLDQLYLCIKIIIETTTYLLSSWDHSVGFCRLRWHSKISGV